MKKRYTGLAVVLISLVAFGVANADFDGVLDQSTTVTSIDSVVMLSPERTFLTPGWGTTPMDTWTFAGVPLPGSITLHGTINGMPTHGPAIMNPMADTWYRVGMGVQAPFVEFTNVQVGVEESKSAVGRVQCLAVSPSVVTEQMTVRLQPVGAGRPVVEIHDAAGNVIRSLNCTAGASGAATATWNREDDFGRLVPEGVYFCRYAAAGVVAVRKVLVTH
jgi:hypothetical protein